MSLLRVLWLPGIAVLAATCEDLLEATSASAAVAAITEAHLSLAEQYSPRRCVPKLLQAGFWEAATALVTQRGDAVLANKDSLQQMALDSKRRADKFIQSLESSNRIQKYETLRVTPAMQWAQSPDKLFLDIKFAHRFDAPGCIELKDQQIDFQRNTLKLSAICKMSGHQLKYVVDFELYDAVNPDNCKSTQSSVGRLSLELEKVTKGYWKLPMKGKKPNNMQIWWEMKARYKKDMKSYFPDDGSHYTDDDEDDEKDKKKKDL